MHSLLPVAAAAFVLSPTPIPPAGVALRRPAVAVTMQVGNFANDGGDIDWDKEAAQLARPANRFYDEISKLEPSDMVKEFAEAAPQEVQSAVKQTVAAMLGTMPEVVGESAITTTGKNLAMLLFNMQMTGYMFKNAQYRQGLYKALSASSPSDAAPQRDLGALPPVKGQITVEIAPGMAANVDAQAYMAELRAEVEGLRAALTAARDATKGQDVEQSLIGYIQRLAPADQQQLTQTVSEEVLEAMSQLVAQLLIDLNIERDTEMEAPMSKLRELLIVQLVTGYRLREIQVKDDLKNKFWDQ